MLIGYEEYIYNVLLKNHIKPQGLYYRKKLRPLHPIPSAKLINTLIIKKKNIKTIFNIYNPIVAEIQLVI